MTDDRAEGRCTLVADDLAAVAVGAATGHERARVLHHLETCPPCAIELDRLAAAGDRLAGLAPEVDPPPGFADRTVDRMLRNGRPAATARVSTAGTTSSRRVVAAVAAALVILGGAAVGELVATAGSSTGPATRAQVAALHSTRGATGTVMVVASANQSSSWVAMTVDAPNAPPTVRCDIVLTDGTTSTIGHFRLAAGYGSWVIPVPVPADAVRDVRLVGPGGTVVASASTT